MTPLLLVVLVPAAAVGLMLGLRSPVGVLVAGYAALVPFGSAIDVPIPLPAPFNTLSSLAGAVAMAALAIHLAVVRPAAPKLLGSMPVWLLLLGLCGFTFFWSVDTAATLEQLILLTISVGLFVLVVLVPATRGEAHQLGTGIVVGAVLSCLYGFFLLATGDTPAGRSGVPRFGTTGGDDPNITAAALVLPLVVAGGRALDVRHRARRARWAASAAVVTGGIMLTGSRGGLLAALVGVTVLGLTGPARARLPVLLAIVLGAGGLALLLAPNALQQRIFAGDSTGRTEVWRLGLVACREHCLTGSGWGTFPAVYQQTFRTDPDAGGYRTGAFKSHSIWLQAAVETGFLGLLLLSAGFVAAARGLLALGADERAPPLAALTALAVSNSLLSNLTFKYFWLVFIYAGVVCVSAQSNPSRPLLASQNEFVVT